MAARRPRHRQRRRRSPRLTLDAAPDARRSCSSRPTSVTSASASPSGPKATARGQDTPNYVTESSYPEMIAGRTNVGDVQSRRLLAILDLKENKTVWADASSFAGVERKAKPADPDVPRLLNWGMPERLRRRLAERRLGAVARQQGSLVREGRSGDRQGHRRSTRCTTTRGFASDERRRRRRCGRRRRRDVAARQQARSLFLSEKDGYMHLYSIDVTAAAARRARSRPASGKSRARSSRPIARRCSSRPTKSIPASGTSTRCRSTAARARASPR